MQNLLPSEWSPHWSFHYILANCTELKYLALIIIQGKKKNENHLTLRGGHKLIKSLFILSPKWANMTNSKTTYQRKIRLFEHLVFGNQKLANWIDTAFLVLQLNLSWTLWIESKYMYSGSMHTQRAKKHENEQLWTGTINFVILADVHDIIGTFQGGNLDT